MTYLSKAMLEYLIKWSRGINRNSDRYNVLNWMKSGIESLYNNSHTIYTVVFSVLLLFFYFFFFFFLFKPSGRTSSIFPRPHQAISRCERKLLRSICSCSGRSTCVAPLNSFSRIREREKREHDRMKSRSILEIILWNVWETTRFLEIRILFKLSILYVYEDRLIF